MFSRIFSSSSSSSSSTASSSAFTSTSGIAGVSAPQNVRRAAGFDQETGSFFGLPPSFIAQLKGSGIEEEEYGKNQDMILNCLKFQQEYQSDGDLPQPEGATSATPAQDAPQAAPAVSAVRGRKIAASGGPGRFARPPTSAVRTNSSPTTTRMSVPSRAPPTPPSAQKPPVRARPTRGAHARRGGAQRPNTCIGVRARTETVAAPDDSREGADADIDRSKYASLSPPVHSEKQEVGADERHEEEPDDSMPPPVSHRVSPSSPQRPASPSTDARPSPGGAVSPRALGTSASLDSFDREGGAFPARPVPPKKAPPPSKPTTGIPNRTSQAIAPVQPAGDRQFHVKKKRAAKVGVTTSAPPASLPPVKPATQQLPPGWEARRDPRGKTFYVDHATKTTHWKLPDSVTAQASAPPAIPAKPPVPRKPATTAPPVAPKPTAQRTTTAPNPTTGPISPRELSPRPVAATSPRGAAVAGQGAAGTMAQEVDGEFVMVASPSNPMTMDEGDMGTAKLAKAPQKQLNLTQVVSMEDPKRRFKDLRAIGQGASGTVYSAQDTHRRCKVAIKEMRLKSDINDKETLVNEIQFMRMCKHPNVIAYVESYLVGGSLWVVMEFVKGCDLSYITQALNHKMTEAVIAKILFEILQAIEYMHSNGLVHRDIKSENVMVGANGDIKIMDFGFGARLTQNSAKRMTKIGTPLWMAPEVIQAQPYGFKVDVWSLGVVCLELLDGMPPYHDIPPLKALFKICSSGLPDPQRVISPDMMDFFNRCRKVNPQERASASELLEHPFLAKRANKKAVQKLVKEQKKAGPKEF